ncbi:T6SS immunity protein Tdi1 domain-containing protein [Stenotrophomonas sp. SY1]|uniref:T6SS immunity protein Tdi1 domain-containing protein n=1 Tax=Stenotrophomonas sp. SY1 TaxID=477235 RepID=UPI001E3A7A6C|nr:T6SS immunity protein Tdi1 domain-containing protein [Stenotrophomonas sp. SY1]MCD9086075.1 DUF1851 domain-containing protein [Stenotrophomonas sp. SY1]
MELIERIRQAWGWTGLQPDQVVGENPFGNLMIKDHDGSYWRLCPEDLYCRPVAEDRAALDALSREQEFLQDWHMAGLVQLAEQQLGRPAPGHCYCLKVPGVLGGAYGEDNLAVIALQELIAASGSLAKQIAHLPDGAQVRLTVVD